MVSHQSRCRLFYSLSDITKGTRLDYFDIRHEWLFSKNREEMHFR